MPAGPPFPSRLPDVVVYDFAQIFSPAAEAQATQIITGIGDQTDADIVVYSQYKPGSDEASTQSDAGALMDEWRVGFNAQGDGLAIFWNTTREECVPGQLGNGQVQLFEGPGFAARMTRADLQAVFDDAMLPLLRECDQDGALIAALQRIEAVVAAQPIPTPGPGDNACTDSAYTLDSAPLTGPFEWYFNEASVPKGYDTDEVLNVIKRAFDNVTQARNDCGLPDQVDAASTYLGTTTEEPCGDQTDRNVVGFGRIPPPHDADYIAETCKFGDDHGVPVYEQIIISTDVQWAMSLEQCGGYQVVLEATVTHEVGHVFGLGHVGERHHGDLTMSPRINGPCENEESTLGLGDVLGLEALYGPN